MSDGTHQQSVKTGINMPLALSCAFDNQRMLPRCMLCQRTLGSECSELHVGRYLRCEETTRQLSKCCGTVSVAGRQSIEYSGLFDDKGVLADWNRRHVSRTHDPPTPLD